jgi:hypothetical protein
VIWPSKIIIFGAKSFGKKKELKKQSFYNEAIEVGSWEK